MWNIGKNFLNAADQSETIVKIDPQWGFAEFPNYGDSKKHLLPVLIDPEEVYRHGTGQNDDGEEEEKLNDKRLKEFWMPDKYCKVCYGCEEAFTMFRRRHHCRLCGQIFCNNCSSNFIEGVLLNMTGSIRTCRTCYDQAMDKVEKEQAKSTKRSKVHEKILTSPAVDSTRVKSIPIEISAEQSNSLQNLQVRASNHLYGIIERLIDASDFSSNRVEWKQGIFNLVREVVSSVDPDVRVGDSIDIRPYVKIKIIPGGLMSECIYIDGVVFRKNVAHKKMLSRGSKENPRILLLASGIEFQRTDMKLSSMDTLIEQEDKFMEILVQKLMSLKPDIILVGKAVARKAQELLCEHNVVVMQNVKQDLLERIARMTGATLLASTDNLVNQYGEECLGTCGQFWLRTVQDDPEKDSSIQPRRVLRTRISRGSSYAYMQGCPSERGCTIVLRGADRAVLTQIKNILHFSIIVAYHLRLEVAYYTDRCADLPSSPDSTVYDDSSDVDDEIIDVDTTHALKLNDATSVLHEFLDATPLAKNRKERNLLSTSLDVDFNVPYSCELIGTQLFRSKHLAKFQVEGHQTLLITSLLIGEGNSFPQQKSPSDLKGIKYYTKHDIALGQFVIDNCFQLSRGGAREPRMLDQTLTFVHRPGRIDVTVKKLEKPINVHDESYYLTRDPHHASLYISAFCKECGKVVLPAKLLSDEAWKMSFGKFLEISFYNRSARCYANGCQHNLRDCHVVSLSCENYVAVFEFVPIHAYSLHVRDSMAFPEEVYYKHTLNLLAQLPIKHLTLMEDFRIAMNILEREIKDLLVGRQEDLALAMGDVHMMEDELNALTITFLEDVLKTYECLPEQYADKDNEANCRFLLAEKLAKQSKATIVPEIQDGSNVNGDVSTPAEASSEEESDLLKKDVLNDVLERDALQEVDPLVARYFPAALMRNTYLRALRWNTRIDTTYRFLESVRKMLLEQQTQPNHPLAIISPTSIATHVAHVLQGEEVAEADPLKAAESIAASHDVARRDDPIAHTVRNSVESISAPSHFREEASYSIALPSTDTAVAAQPVGMTSLYRVAIEQNRRTAEKPVDKMSRITKALSRFLAGKDSSADEQQKFIVPLGDFGTTRLGIKPGRNGEVIPVSEDILPSVIAYALATNEYYEGLQASLHEKHVDQTDYESMAHDSDQSGLPPAPNSDKKGDASAPPAAPTESSRHISLPFKKKKQPVSAKLDPNNLSPIPEENMEEQDLDNEEQSSSVLTKTNTYGLKTFMEGFSNHEDGANSDKNDVSAFGSAGMFDYSKTNEDGAEHSEGSSGIKQARVANTTNQDNKSADKSALGDMNNTSTSPNNSTKEEASQGSATHSNNPYADRKGDTGFDDMSPNEKQMISQDKSNIRVRFDDFDDLGSLTCKFQCQIYWAKQFEAVRNCYFQEEENRENYIRSLAMTNRWVAQGGKSGASFAKTADERLVIKVISRVELQMFLDFAPAYFEYMAKAYYHNLPTVLCKILGIYTVRYDNKETGKKSSENVVVMENIFYQRNITRTFDLKGSSRARYVELIGQKLDSVDDLVIKRRRTRRHLKFRTSTVENERDSNLFTAPEAEQLRATLDTVQKIPQVLLDDNFMELTKGRPFPLKHRAKMFFHKAVQNDTLFLSIVNVVDYSILVGFDDKSHEITVGIIDYLRQYDIIKKMERVGKGSVGMLTGQAEPTIIQPSQYRKRFTAAMERYFMTVPDKWISYDT